MLEEILKAIPIFLLSALKVVLGPTLGYAAGLNIFTSMVVTFAGMMTSVVLVTFFGSLLQKGFLKNWFAKREAKAKNSKWKRYGLVGIAILTPLLLTPIGGSLIAVIGGYPRPRILLFMLISASVFSIAANTAMYRLGPDATEYLKSSLP